MKRSLLFIVLIALLAMSLSTSFATKIYATENESAILRAIENVITDFFGQTGWTDFYYFDEVSILPRTIISNDSFESEVTVLVTKRLKITDTKQLPYIQGLYQAAGVPIITPHEKLIQVVEDTNNFPKEVSEKIVELITTFESELRSSIQEVQERQYTFLINGSIEKGIVIEQFDYKLFGRVDPQSIVPEDKETNYQIGFYCMQEKIAVELKANNISNIPLQSYYNRYLAYTYANTYTSNPSSCSECGYACGVNQNTSVYNKAYPSYNHNDCANYVSQALRAGGLGTNSTWSSGTLAWINVASLDKYLNNNNLLIYSNYSNVLSGGIIYLPGTHVMMVVKNDGIERLFSAHTNDVRQGTFGSMAGWYFCNIN